MPARIRLLGIGENYGLEAPKHVSKRRRFSLAQTTATPYGTCVEHDGGNTTELKGVIVAMNALANMQDVDVRSVRRERGLTQQAFADTFGFTIGAVRDWEQGRKRPDRAARILLAVIRTAPDAVADAAARVGRGSI
jgi:DNA-binding transcriptional regulator YiaG